MNIFKRAWIRFSQGAVCPKCKQRTPHQNYDHDGGCLDCFEKSYRVIRNLQDAKEREARIEEMAEAIRRARCG